MSDQKVNEREASEQSEQASDSGQETCPPDTSSSSAPERRIKPVAEKPGEKYGNLQHRGEWYQRRTSGSD